MGWRSLWFLTLAHPPTPNPELAGAGVSGPQIEAVFGESSTEQSCPLLSDQVLLGISGFFRVSQPISGDVTGPTYLNLTQSLLLQPLCS